ncbi:MAG: phage portal protein [Cognatishimia sp.]|nr:phage portal protein [Cognatishimia sp.]
MGLMGWRKRGGQTQDSVDQEARADVTWGDAGAASISEVLNAAPMAEGVTMKEGMSLPAVWAAVNFLAAVMASLPIEVFEKTQEEGGDKKVKGQIVDTLNAAINDDMTSADWRELKYSEVFGPGRGYTYIERDSKNWPINLFFMEYDRTQVVKRGGRIFYEYHELDGRVKTYPGKDVIDVAFLRKPNFVESHNPVLACAAAIRQGLNANRYALTVFGKNGIPPYVLKGPFQAAKAAMNAAADIMKVARRSAEEGKPILPIPSGHDLVRLGDDPDKMQLTPVQTFAVLQVARIYQLPPVFLQELTKGNFNNMEHQDLHLVKHTLRRHVTKFEQQMTLKLFGRNSKFYVKLNLDDLMRGDFKTRIEAIVRGITNGLFTPNEGREMMDKPPLPGGGKLMIQGATVPIEMAGTAFNKNAPPATEAAPEGAAEEEPAE